MMHIERVNMDEERERRVIASQGRAKREVSPEHLEALDQGRKEGAIVRHYLDALENLRPKRGRKPDLNKLRERLTDLEQKIQADNVSLATRLNLIQERKNLTERLSVVNVDNSGDLQKYEDEFVRVAAAYAQRKGIKYETFKEVGVPVRVLKRAGITRKTHAAA